MKIIIGKINPKKEITIIGAGISGLLMGYYLKKAGFKIKILEREKKPGGLISTALQKEGPVETAANAILANDDVIELLKELELDFIEARPKIKRFIQRDNKLLSFPFTLIEFFFIFLKLFFKKIPVKEEQTLHEFMEPLLGTKICDEVLSTAVAGIYATDAKELHYQALFPKALVPQSYWHFFKNFIKQRTLTRVKYKIKTSISFKKGMQELIDRLSENLKDIIHYEQEIVSIDNTLICTNAYDAALIVQNYDASTALKLKKIEYKKVTTQTRFYEKGSMKLKGAFGVLFSRKTNYFSFGILANNQIFSHRGQFDNYTFIAPLKNDTEKKIDQDATYFDLETSKLKSVYTTHWEKAIPIYNYERKKLIEDIDKNLGLKNTAFFGNYVSGISIRDLIGNAKKFSLELQRKDYE